MPNQNYCSPRQDFMMEEYGLSLPYNSKPESKLCKYAYATWCPTCDRESPRRRSRSETNEPCRRKGREMKSLTPRKIDRNQECENMDLEYETKDSRYDYYRVRANLCELPTTYITNNCQIISSMPSMNKLSTGADFMDYVDKNSKNFDSALKYYDDMYEFGGNHAEKQKIKLENHSRNGVIPKVSPSKFDIKPHYLNGVRNCCSEKSPLKDMVQVKNMEIIRLPQKTRSVPGEKSDSFVDQKSQNVTHCRSTHGDFKYSQSKNGCITTVSPKNNFEYSPCNIVNLKFHDNLERGNLCYDTCTFFDKTYNTEDLKERYNKEVEVLREKLRELKGTASRAHDLQNKKIHYTEIKSTTNETPYGVPYETIPTKVGDSYSRIIPVNERKNQEENSVLDEKSKLLKLNTKPTVAKAGAKVTLKTRSKVNVIKVKKVRNKPVMNASTPSSGSDASDSELSDTGEISKEEAAEEEVESPSEPSADESGDAVAWPLRQSLFPNVPPYISFNSHDAKNQYKLPAGRRFLKWKMSSITPLIVRKTLVNTGFRLVISECKSNEWIGTWGKHMKSPVFQTLKDSQKFNHMPGTFQIGRKDRLCRNFQRMIARFGQKEFGFMPQTYVLPQDLKLLKQNWEYKNGSGNEKWIIKPPASARGVGIKVINKWSQLPKRMSLVVQKYISNPYLINGSKFDLRLYVLVTSFCPLKIYLYPDGLARFASAKYSEDAKDLKDRYMHLTNYSINKLSSHYTANEDANACQGHKWTISKLWEYMQKDGVDTKALWKTIQQLVIKTMLSGENSITHLSQENLNSYYNCYELFGVDVLLDENLRTWLLEVNISPSLHSASPLDAHVKGPLVKSLFNMAQFHLPPRLSRLHKDLQCLEPKMYVKNLTKLERNKHTFFTQVENREDYMDQILDDLTGDDVRQLIRYEDELTVKGQFEKIFPTTHSYKYLQFIEPRYYNRLFDAWETKYEKNRAPGIKLLQSLCAQKVHLATAPPPSLDKNLSNMSLGEQNLLPSREGQSHPSTENSQESPPLLPTAAESIEEKTPFTKQMQHLYYPHLSQDVDEKNSLPRTSSRANNYVA